MIWAANINAPITVNHSGKLKFNWGGPLIHPAPKVAKITPPPINKVSFCLPKTNPISAVKTTYKLVKNAETAGVTSGYAIPIIWKKKPAQTNIPNQIPPFLTFTSKNASLTFVIKGIKIIDAIKNLKNTKEDASVWCDKFGSASFATSIAQSIQINVKPQINVTNIKPNVAFFLVLKYFSII